MTTKHGAKLVDYFLWLPHDRSEDWFLDLESEFGRYWFEATLVPRYNRKLGGWLYELSGIYPSSPVRGFLPEWYQEVGQGRRDLQARKKRRKHLVERSILRLAEMLNVPSYHVYIVGSKLTALSED